jgi:hypothetical protein
MKILAALALPLIFSSCVTVPIPPFGDRVGDLGSLKLSLKVDYLPKISPEQKPSSPELYAWEKFKLTKPKLLKDK